MYPTLLISILIIVLEEPRHSIIIGLVLLILLLLVAFKTTPAVPVDGPSTHRSRRSEAAIIIILLRLNCPEPIHEVAGVAHLRRLVSERTLIVLELGTFEVIVRGVWEWITPSLPGFLLLSLALGALAILLRLPSALQPASDRPWEVISSRSSTIRGPIYK